jgi:hypothetical protein
MNWNQFWIFRYSSRWFWLCDHSIARMLSSTQDISQQSQIISGRDIRCGYTSQWSQRDSCTQSNSFGSCTSSSQRHCMFRILLSFSSLVFSFIWFCVFLFVVVPFCKKSSFWLFRLSNYLKSLSHFSTLSRLSCQLIDVFEFVVSVLYRILKIKLCIPTSPTNWCWQFWNFSIRVLLTFPTANLTSFLDLN